MSLLSAVDSIGITCVCYLWETVLDYLFFAIIALVPVFATCSRQHRYLFVFANYGRQHWYFMSLLSTADNTGIVCHCYLRKTALHLFRYST